jgi:hypothetical protein
MVLGPQDNCLLVVILSLLEMLARTQLGMVLPVLLVVEGLIAMEVEVLVVLAVVLVAQAVVVMDLGLVEVGHLGRVMLEETIMTAVTLVALAVAERVVAVAVLPEEAARLVALV